MDSHADPEAHLHVAEIKVRLTPGQADRLRALARRGDAPPAVLARTLLLRALTELERQLDAHEQPDRRAA